MRKKLRDEGNLLHRPPVSALKVAQNSRRINSILLKLKEQHVAMHTSKGDVASEYGRHAGSRYEYRKIR